MTGLVSPCGNLFRESRNFDHVRFEVEIAVRIHGVVIAVEPSGTVMGQSLFVTSTRGNPAISVTF